MQNLLLFLNSIYPLSIELQQHLAVMLKSKIVKKKDFLLRTGETCTNVYFVESGLIRCFYKKEEKEICSWFMREGDVIISVESFFKQKPSYESIQALEKSSVYYISYSELQDIYMKFSEFNFIGRVLVERYYVRCEERLFTIRYNTAQERYHYLINNQSELIRNIASKYIASYLGVSEITLSRIKRKKLP